MDIKIGFTESPRELVIASAEDHDAVVERVQSALTSGEGVLDFTDANGRRVLVRNATIAYVEVGSGAQRPVGFVGV